MTKFTGEMESSKKEIVFLDTIVGRGSGELVADFYSKPTSGTGLLPYLSTQPLNLKINTARQKLRRINEICMKNVDKVKHKRMLNTDLKTLLYPRNIINRIFNNHKDKRINPERTYFLPLKYSKELEHKMKNCLNNENTKICWKRGNNILDLYKEPHKQHRNLETKT